GGKLNLSCSCIQHRQETVTVGALSHCNEYYISDASSSVTTYSVSSSSCEDPPDDCIDQSSFLQAFNLVEKSLLNKEGYKKLSYTFPLRLIARSSQITKLENSLRPNYVHHMNQIFEDMDLCSPLGQQVLRTNNRGFLDPTASLLSVNKCEKYCRFSVVSLHPGLYNIPHLRNREMLTKYPITYRPFRKTQQNSSHQYSFNSQERRERFKVLKTGLNKRGRELKKQCKTLRIKVNRLSKEEIKKWVKKSSPSTGKTIRSSDDDLYEVQFMGSSQSLLSSSNKPILVFLPLSVKQHLEIGTKSQNTTQNKLVTERQTLFEESKNSTSYNSANLENSLVTELSDGFTHEQQTFSVLQLKQTISASSQKSKSLKNRDLFEPFRSTDEIDVCLFSKPPPWKQSKSCPKTYLIEKSTPKPSESVYSVPSQDVSGMIQASVSKKSRSTEDTDLCIIDCEHLDRCELSGLSDHSFLTDSDLKSQNNDLLKMLLQTPGHTLNETPRTRCHQQPGNPVTSLNKGNGSPAVPHHKPPRVLKLPQCSVKLVDVKDTVDDQLRRKKNTVKISEAELVNSSLVSGSDDPNQRKLCERLVHLCGAKPEVEFQLMPAQMKNVSMSELQSLALKLLKKKTEAALQTAGLSRNVSSCSTVGYKSCLSSPNKQRTYSKQQPIKNTNSEKTKYNVAKIDSYGELGKFVCGANSRKCRAKKSVSIPEGSKNGNICCSNSNLNTQKKSPSLTPPNFPVSKSVAKEPTNGIHFVRENPLRDTHTVNVRHSPNSTNHLSSDTSRDLTKPNAVQWLTFSEGETYSPCSNNITLPKKSRISLQGPSSSTPAVLPDSLLSPSTSRYDRNLPHFQKEPTKWLFKCNGCGFAASFIHPAQAERDITQHVTAYHAVIDPAYHLAEYSLKFVDHTEVVIEAFMGHVMPSPAQSPSVDCRLSAKAESNLVRGGECSHQFCTGHDALDDVVALDHMNLN
ncbi:uncharacterized protein LOC106476768, partial [Limulus polyphemus]|uniref:Uncharacterized protein LOC106476768 n=1 Tax=Limulus polyphemus TaxID=6850 RepID=A0ABM1C222_LIMPO